MVNPCPKFDLRLAQEADLPPILAIVAQCQALLRSRGVDQWQDGYPSLEPLQADIALSRGYVLTCGERIAAYGALVEGEEAAYLSLRGEWLTDYPYLTLHRLAVSDDFRGCGVGDEFFAAMQRVAQERNLRSLRADTHRDNSVMQRLLHRSGFTLCGDVYYGASHRLGYEKIINADND